jgi:predicted dehydrogenase
MASSQDRQPKPRIGLLSFAHYHANFWAEVFGAQGALAGIWDDDPERGREAAERFGVPFHDDLQTLLRCCTAVAICSETVRHAKLVERAAACGLSVLVEKPIATSSLEARRIGAAVREHGVRFMQSFPKRLDAVSTYLKRVVDDGEIGPVHLVRIRHGHHYGLTAEFPTRWYVQPELAGGGALLDEGIHGADLLAWLFGMPKAVTALTSHAALDLGVEDLGIATYRFDNGLVAELTASFCFAAADSSIEFYGRQGTVLVSAVDLASRDVTDAGFVRICRRATPDTAPRWETIPLTPQFKRGQFHQQSARAFFEGLRDGSPFPAGFEEGARALRMIEAAYESARSGRTVTFQESVP